MPENKTHKSLLVVHCIKLNALLILHKHKESKLFFYLQCHPAYKPNNAFCILSIAPALTRFVIINKVK